MKFISFDQFVKILESQQISEQTSGEKDYGIFMKYTIAMINLAKRKAKYPKLYKVSKDLELDEIKDKQEVALESDDLTDRQIEGIKTKIKTAKDNLKKNTQLSAEQKKLERSKLNDLQDEAIKKVNANVSKTIDNEKSKIGEQYTVAKNKITKELQELESKNPVSDVPSLQAEWDEYKENIKLKINSKFFDQKLALETEGDLDPEQIKRAQERAKKQQKQLQEDAKKRLEEINAEKKEAEQALQDTINNAANDPDAADAAGSIMDFNKAFQAFTKLADGYSEDSSEQELKAIKDAKKAVNAAKAKLSASKFVKAKFVNDKEEGEQLVASYKKDVDDAMNAYEELADKLGSSAQEELKAKRDAIKAINDEIKKLEKSKNEKAPQGETEDQKTARIKNIDDKIEDKRKERDELEKVEGESSSNYKQQSWYVNKDYTDMNESNKPWYRKSDGALNESIAQKFSRLLNKKV